MNSIYKFSICLIILSRSMCGPLTISRQTECGAEGEIASELDGQCYFVGTRGPCEENQRIVLHDKRGVCQDRQCEEAGELVYRDQCTDMFARGVCPTGERLFLTLKGKGECDCKEGWMRKYPIPYCYQQFTRGFCQPGKILDIKHLGQNGTKKKLVCIENPCSPGKLPHTDTWEKNGTCHEANKGDLEKEDCEVEVWEEDNSLRCASKKESLWVPYSIAPLSQKRKCKRGRIWNKYKKFCVRTFRG